MSGKRTLTRTGPRMLVVGVVAMVLAACAAPAPEPTMPWAATAEDYIHQVHAAYTNGFTNLALFYAPDVAVDHRVLGGEGLAGRAAAVQYYRDVWQSEDRQIDDRVDTAEGEPVYLSAEGAVDVHRFGIPNLTGPWVPVAFVYTVGETGIRSEMFSGSVQSADANQVTALTTSLPPVNRYVSAWAGGDATAVAALYATDAAVVDSLTGVRLTSAAAIGVAASTPASAGGLPGARLRTVVDEGGPAVYINGPIGADDHTKVDLYVLLLTADEGNGCPGEVAVVLELRGGKIANEKRFHRVDAVRRCMAPTALPTGWWDVVTPPPADSVTRTGTVTLRGQDTALWNGAPGLDGLVTWAVSRFADVPLLLPTGYPTSVTFLPPGADCQVRYGFVPGASDLALCAQSAQICTDAACDRWQPQAKLALLHQLARGWLARSLDLKARKAFVRRTGLAWSDPDLPVAKQGVERAAATMAWGLMDEPSSVDTAFGPLSCGQLARDFRLLTGLSPLGVSCAEPMP